MIDPTPVPLWTLRSVTGHRVICSLREGVETCELALQFPHVRTVHQTFTSRTLAVIYATNIANDLLRHGWEELVTTEDGAEQEQHA